jgi:hypothetical protein
MKALDVLLFHSVHAQGIGPAAAPRGTVPGNVSLIDAIGAIANFFLVLIAVIALIILVLAGVRYITAQGEDDQVEQAKHTILYAGVGLIVIGLSAAIVNFVLESFRNT